LYGALSFENFLPAVALFRQYDNTLYQCHLEFGVLTINAIRRSLAIEAILWGKEDPLEYLAAKGPPGFHCRIKRT
jgi:hypothetical protein